MKKILLAAALSALACLAFTVDRVVAEDLHGHVHAPLAAEATTVLIFITVDCPIANAYAPEIKRIISAYSSKGVKFYIVQTDPQLRVAEAKKHAADYGYKVPVLLDRNHSLVKAAGARVTPEVAVYSKGKQMYLGRIDDLYYGLGKRRAVVKSRDLRAVLDAVLAGRKPPKSAIPAVGCIIPKL
jgi:hypothetical protein